jgi:hypothetical protein
VTRAPYLTKSRFKLATECPRKLYYTGKPEYANTRSDDEFLQSLAEGGYQVGELAKLMFPGGVEITATGHEEALRKTADALRADEVTLFEAAIRYDRCFVRVDVLVRQGSKVRVIEVKSKSYDPQDEHFFVGKRGQITRDILPYLLDVAFQTLVVRRALPDCEVSAALMLPNKGLRATVDGLNGLFPIHRLDGERRRIEVRTRPGLGLADVGEPLLSELDVTPIVNGLLEQVHTFPGATGTIEQLAWIWAEQYESGVPIDPPVQSQCKGCEFRAPAGSELRCGLTECWAQALHVDEDRLQQPLVLDLWDGRRTERWMREGKHLLRQLDLDDLGEDPITRLPEGLTRVGRQWMQISGQGLNDAGYLFLPEVARAEMARWRYPLNLIDFETSRTALPFHKGDRPFGLVAFQFSHHVLHEDGSLVHAGEFLCTEPGVHPNLAFVRALQNALSANDGTVLMWSPYENSVLNELRRQLVEGECPAADAVELTRFIESITVRKEGSVLLWEGPRAMVDMKPLSSAAFFHRRAGGSNSIKKVLPAMLEASTWLRERYARPAYGGGRPDSRNFAEAMTWWQPDATGRPVDPYKLLPPVFANWPVPEDDEEGGPTLSQGGAALMAYSRLQFEEVSDAERSAWNQALLRYCELDTLAMAMIIQGWRAWL